jgi:hypothetical protein
MKRYFKFLIICVGVFLISCNSESKNKLTSESKQNKLQKVEPNQTLVVEVEGMVCKMGCGGAIRKELILTNAVARVEVDFIEGEKSQTLKIQYDNQLISQAEIVRKMEKINNKQFKVYPIGTSEIGNTITNSQNEKSNVNMAERTIELPNLLEILSSFITQ